MAGVHFKNRVKIPPNGKEISIYEVTNMHINIGEFFINYEMTIPKR